MADQGGGSELTASSSPDDREALDQLIAIVYGELRRIAHRELAHERPEHTLGTTALVNEAYLKLAQFSRIEWVTRSHVLGYAAQAMRRILVDYAKARRAQKRGGGAERVALDESRDAMAMAATRSSELIALDEALRRLEAMKARHARVIECRFFGGMSIEETAQALEVSPATVKREWMMARAWLNRELSQ